MPVCVSCPKCGLEDWVVGDLPVDLAGVKFACSCGHTWTDSRWDNMMEFIDAYMSKEAA